MRAPNQMQGKENRKKFRPTFDVRSLELIALLPGSLSQSSPDSLDLILYYRASSNNYYLVGRTYCE